MKKAKIESTNSAICSYMGTDFWYLSESLETLMDVVYDIAKTDKCTLVLTTSYSTEGVPATRASLVQSIKPFNVFGSDSKETSTMKIAIYSLLNNYFEIKKVTEDMTEEESF